MSRAALCLLLPLLACGPALNGESEAAPGSASNPFIQGRTLNIAHQGGELLWPSNTMVAYHNALHTGADMLETDLHATRDGVLVMSHDDTLDRLTDRGGRIRELTLEQVLEADAGYRLTPVGQQGFPFRDQGVRVAQLSEVLSGLPPVLLSIEIKQDPSVAQPLCGALREADATHRVVVASFSTATLQEFRSVCPEVITSMTADELRPLVLLSKLGLSHLAAAPGQVAQVPLRSGGIAVVTPGFVRAMQARGVAVQVWTVNDPEEMQRLIGLGVDGIITDRPDLLARLLRAEAE